MCRLQKFCMSSVHVEGTDEEGFHTPTSTLSRASSTSRSNSRPASALVRGRYPAYQNAQAHAWVRF